jgi:hypothetical protein
LTPQDASAPYNDALVGNVTYHGGPVMHSVTNYAIFWLPPGYHFDTPTIDPGYPKASDANYEALVGQYFHDLSDTAFYSILQQYTDSSGAPGMATAFGGSWVDTSPYPNSEGTRANPLQDSDIQAEVTKAMAANHWADTDGNSEFFVFTGQDVYSCGGEACSYDGYCSYHSALEGPAGQNVTYANIPDPGNEDASSCLATAVTGVHSPNSGAFADSAVNLVAHEGFEGITDPVFDGWYYQDTNHEVADECVWKFGAVSSDGSNILLNGHKYLIQEMWSNKAGGCYLPPVVPTLPVVASYSVEGGGSGFAPPSFTYYSGGVLQTAVLSTTPQDISVDFGTVWNVTGTLAGSTQTERWQTGQDDSGTLRFAGTLAFTYYHQYLVNFGFAVEGGGNYTAPSITIGQFGYQVVANSGHSAGPEFWADAGSSYSYTNPLDGSSASERWVAPSASGIVTSADPVSVVYHHQYLVAFRVTDASGSKTLIPTSLQILASQSNATVDVQGSEAWVDASSTFVVSQVLWEGDNVAPSNQVVVVDAPQNVTIAARVYDVSLVVSDYLQVPISGASAIIQLPNGTSIVRTTGAGGTISLASIPAGRLNATVSYLGFSQRTSAEVAAQDAQVKVSLPASLPDFGAALLVLIVAALIGYAVVRQRRARAVWRY